MDNYIVSARKYRPSTFQSVVGQKALTQTLKNAIDSKKLAHAYLFCGPRGVGKTSCARIFAKTINCAHPTATGEACNECESCRAFNEQRSYNISELDAASNNSVEDIRNLTDQVRIPPQIGEYKVFIIDEVHMLSMAAFNAFLKTLEEPPHHAIFILATTEKHKILPTILSRCQIYDFQRITTNDIAEHLQYVASKEGVHVEPEALNVIAQKADGGMRDALSIFDQIVSFTAGNVTYQSVIENLNVLDYEYYFRLVDAFLAGNVSQALLLFKEVRDHGFEAQHFVGGLGRHLRDLLVSKDPVTLPLLEVSDSVSSRYGEQAARCTLPFLYKALELSNRCDLDYRISNNKQLLVELLLIQICQLLNPVAPASGTSGDTPLKPISASPAPASPAPQRPVSTPQNTVVAPPPARPAAAPAVQPAPQNIPPASAAVPPPAYTVAKEPEAPYRRSVSPTPTSSVSAHAPSPRISIRNAVKTAPQETVKRTVEVWNTPFDETKLREAWVRYTDTIPTEVALVNTMRSCLPVLGANYQFEIVVDNQMQIDMLREHGVSLNQFLQRELHNTQFTMKLRESEQTESQKIFGPKETVVRMTEKNPDMTDFLSTFDLELA